MSKRRVRWGKKIDFDLLMKLLFNVSTVDKDLPHNGRRKTPEHIVPMRFDYDCGLGAFSTWMLILDREDVLKTDLYSRLGVNEVDGTKSEKIKEVLNDEKIAYAEVTNAKIEDLEAVIGIGGSCLVSYQAWGEPAEIEKMECGHYSIVFDIDEEFVWLIDPSEDVEYTPGFGKGVVRRTREEFEKLWVDKGADGTIYDHWLLAARI